MRTIEKTIYQFDELNEDAKERARAWYRNGQEWNWCEESEGAILAFCERFGVTLKYSGISPYYPIDYSTDATNANFRGLKLKDIDRDAMPTGYCLDCTLWYTFHDEFRRTGDALASFDAAVYAGLKDWQADLESQTTEEYIDDAITSNEYEFNEDGSRS